jgi:hypothetical protein
MLPSENLLHYQEYAESIGRTINLSSQEWSEVPDSIREIIQRIQRNAQKTLELASKPVRIGITGEFSTGKTLLLGNLIGYADALPCSETATTGNVTTLHLIQQDDLQETHIGDFTVKYLNQQEVEDCLRFMLEELKVRSREAQLTSEHLDRLAVLKPSESQIWNQLEENIEEAWKQTNNPRLRFLLRELFIFARTYTYGSVLCGHQDSVTVEIANSGLKLAQPPQNIQTLTFEELRKSVEKLQHPLSTVPQQLNPDLLQATFSLVSQIESEVKLSKEIWDLSPLQGSKGLIIQDFPGLGAASSSVRDTFLCLQALDRIQTILILLDGRKPGGAEALPIFDMLQKRRTQENLQDFILVGVGRFDQIPLDDELETIFPDLTKLDAQAQDDWLSETEPLTENTVLEKLPVLQNHLATAQALTTKAHRIVFLSPLLGMAHLSKNLSIKVSSDEFLAKLNSRWLGEYEQIQEKWRQLGETLKQSGSSLGQKLSDFAQDGGTIRLRELILNHVAEHSLKQLYQDVSNAYADLEQGLQDLKDQQSREPIDDLSPAVTNLRKLIRGLQPIYRDIKITLQKAPDLAINKVPVSKIVCDELVSRIFKWNQWTLLHEKTRNGTIEIRAQKSFLDEAEELGEVSIPVSSDELYPIFEKTVLELEAYSRQYINRAIQELLQDWLRQVSPLHELLPHAITTTEFKQKLTQKFPQRIRQLNALLFAAFPNRLEPLIVRQCYAEEKSPSKIKTPKFPLARNNPPDEVAQVFDWAPERRQINSQKGLDLFTVLRLRDVMIDSASRQLVQVVSEINQQFNQQLISNLEDINFALLNLSRDEELLRYLAEEEQTTNVAVPKWLKIASELISSTQEKT